MERTIKMNDKLDFLLFLAAIIAGILLGTLFTLQINTKSWEMEAVRKGHATWEANSNGAACFTWKEASK